jgi:hypothetical protein
MLNENLIQVLTAYTSTLEQQLAALEARVASLEEQLTQVTSLNTSANEQIVSMKEELAAVAAGIVAAQHSEPEVEIELIMNEEEDTQENTVAISEEVTEEIAESPETPLNTEILEPTPAETPEEKPIEEVVPTVESEVVEETVAKEPVEEPVQVEQDLPEVKEETKPVPTPSPVASNTPLFGPAVADIRQAISLGDRFLFQRELFGGNGELMQKTLDILNQKHDFDDALAYINKNFEWNQDSSTYELFINVLHRRF